MRTFFHGFVLVTVALLAPRSTSSPCSAEEPVAGEAKSLTDDVSAQAQKHVDTILAQGKDSAEAVRSLLVLGPVIWPVVEAATRSDLAEPVRAHLNLLKALLVVKKDADFEALRVQLRQDFVDNATGKYHEHLLAFRRGRPDPSKPGKFLALGVKPKQISGASVYRSADGTIVVAFGADGTEKKPDGGDVMLKEPEAGFVAAVGGTPASAAPKSGRGGNVKVEATLGYAVGCATDGAAGKAPGGAGGDGGVPEAKGGAGSFKRAGSGGAGASG